MNGLTIIANSLTATNRGLLEAFGAIGLAAVVLSPDEAARRLRADDVALGRLDVRPTLDGPEPGFEALRKLEERGVAVLNRAGALLGAHDKLTTAIRLAARRVPHPRTAHIDTVGDPPSSSRWW